MNKKCAVTLLALLLALLLAFAASCGEKREGAQPSLEEAKVQAKEAIDSAELLLQGARPGTDLSDARELLDQARALYGQGAAVDDYVGPDRSVLTLAEEAKSKARKAMEAEKL